MADCAVKAKVPAETGPKLPKPVMRGLLARNLKFGLAFSFAASGLCALYWKIFHMDYRQKKTKEYFATYDPVKEYERMRDMGMFQWAKPKPGSKPIYEFYQMEPEVCTEEDFEEVAKVRGRCVQYEDGSSDE